jgi:hypothetical protein
MRSRRRMSMTGSGGAVALVSLSQAETRAVDTSSASASVRCGMARYLLSAFRRRASSTGPPAGWLDAVIGARTCCVTGRSGRVHSPSL